MLHKPPKTWITVEYDIMCFIVVGCEVSKEDLFQAFVLLLIGA